MASIGNVEAILVTAVFAAIVAIAGVITQRVITRRAHTLDYLCRVDNDKDLIDARTKFIELTADDALALKYALPAHFSEAEAIALRLVLNENEKLAIALQFGVLDRKFVERHCRGMLIRDWELAAPFIYKLRKEIGNPGIYREFEDLAAMLQRVRKYPRSYFWKLWF